MTVSLAIDCNAGYLQRIGSNDATDGIQTQPKEAKTMNATVTNTETPKKPARQIKTPGAPQKAVKAKPAPTTEKAPRQAAAPKVNQHVEAKVSVGDYTGLSSMINNNRKTSVMVAPARATGSLTERHQKSLYALRKAYGDKKFGAKGFDNGVLRDLLAAGLIKLSGGVSEVIDGKTYWLDGPTPLMVNFTTAGMNYGKVA